MTESKQIKWLQKALIQCLDTMGQAECDLSITPVEMTAEQYEDLTLRVADNLGDVYGQIVRRGELAGFDLDTPRVKFQSANTTHQARAGSPSPECAGSPLDSSGGAQC